MSRCFRRSGRLVVSLLAFSVACLLPVAARAQGQAIDGNIEGLVRTQAGEPIAGATVRMFNVGTGAERVVTTDARGRYAASVLPPGEYVVTVEAQGFATVTRTNLELRASQVLAIDFDVPPTSFNETVEVTAAPPLVQVASTSVTNTYEERVVRSLPTIGRSLMDFFVLQPGVNSAPLPTTGSGTSTATTVYGGLVPRLLNVDGVSNNIQGRSRNIVISQDAIAETQVITNFSAEFGRSVGGAQNVVTKSGTNATRGSAFFFTRQKALTGRYPLAPANEPKPDFSRYNFGGTMGGAIRQHKLFYFLSYERWMQDNPQVSTISAANAALLKIPSSSVGAITGTFRAHTLTARADAQLNSNHRFSARFNYYYDRESPIGGGLASQETFTRFDESPYSFTTQLVSVIRPNIVNENRFLKIYREVSRAPGGDENAPNINVTGVGSFNGSANGTNVTRESGMQFIDNLSISAGAHTVKLGFDIIPVSFEERTTNINGSFRFTGLAAVTGVRGAVSPLDQYLFTVAGTIDPATGRPYSYSRFTQAVGAEFTKPSVVNHGYFIQDDIRLPGRVKLNVGLRYELFGRPKGSANPLLPQTGEFPTDKNNVAPRVGIVWDPTGSGKTAVRAGWGVYYNVFVTQNFNTLVRSNGKDVVTVNLTPTQAGAPAFTLGRVTPPTAGSVVSEIRMMSPDFEDIQAQLWFATVDRQVLKNLSLAVSYYGNRSSNQPVSIVTNITQNGTLPDGRRRWSTANRPDPRFANIYVAQSIGDSKYNGLVTTLTKRFSAGYSFQASYHLSKSDSAGYLDDNLGFGLFDSPSDPQDLEVDRGRNDNDMRHRFTATGVFEPKWSRLTGATGALINGWQLSTRTIAQSGFPRNVLTGLDDNGDGVINDRPSGVAYNAYEQKSFVTIDLRLSRRFRFGAQRVLEVMFEGFNMTDRLNITALNNTWGPGTTPSASFGQPTAAESPRQFQVAARFTF